MGGGDKKAEMILVRTVSAEPKDGLYRRRMRFHQVDLSKGKLISNCFPSMLTRIGDGAMVRSDGPVVYLIGGVIDGPVDEPGSDDVYYKGCCRLDVQKEEGRGWEQIDLPIKNLLIASCASLFGKLYEFGYPRLHTPEIFDPSVGFWKELSPLPSEFVGCRVSDRVIPDPCNSRLLVHLSQGKLPSCTLCAFYPDSDKWERIGSMHHWSSHNVALLDGVLYIHDSDSRDFIYAYDVARRQPVNVTWSSQMYGRVNVTQYEYDAMFYTGDSHFTMAIWTPPRKSNNITTSTIFFKFKADRSENGLHIVCTPVDVQSHDLQISARVSGFLQLQEASN